MVTLHKLLSKGELELLPAVPAQTAKRPLSELSFYDGSPHSVILDAAIAILAHQRTGKLLGGHLVQPTIPFFENAAQRQHILSAIDVLKFACDRQVFDAINEGQGLSADLPDLTNRLVQTTSRMVTDTTSLLNRHALQLAPQRTSAFGHPKEASPTIFQDKPLAYEDLLQIPPTRHCYEVICWT